MWKTKNAGLLNISFRFKRGSFHGNDWRGGSRGGFRGGRGGRGGGASRFQQRGGGGIEFHRRRGAFGGGGTTSTSSGKNLLLLYVCFFNCLNAIFCGKLKDSQFTHDKDK